MEAGESQNSRPHAGSKSKRNWEQRQRRKENKKAATAEREVEVARERIEARISTRQATFAVSALGKSHQTFASSVLLTLRSCQLKWSRVSSWLNRSSNFNDSRVQFRFSFQFFRTLWLSTRYQQTFVKRIVRSKSCRACLQTGINPSSLSRQKSAACGACQLRAEGSGYTSHFRACPGINSHRTRPSTLD